MSYVSLFSNQQLREAVRLFGVGNWSKITTLVPSRTPVQCRERWVNVLDNHINRGPWSKEDDRKLFELCSVYTGQSVACFPGQSPLCEVVTIVTTLCEVQ